MIIKKIESQAPQRNEEYYKFTNQKKIYANNDPIYGTRTLTNWNHKIINQERPLYIQTDQNIYNNNNNNNANVYYNNDDRIIPTDSNLRNQVKQILKGDNNYHFNSTVDLRQINYNPRLITIQGKNRNKFTNSINPQINKSITKAAPTLNKARVLMCIILLKKRI